MPMIEIAGAAYTNDRIAAMEEALERLFEACDGAHADDGVGFCRDDMQTGRELHFTGWDSDRVSENAEVQRFLARYSRTQIADLWPRITGEKPSPTSPSEKTVAEEDGDRVAAGDHMDLIAGGYYGDEW